MKKAIRFAFAMSAIMLLAGCNGKMQQFAADYFSTNPNPLEVKGDMVPATVTGRVPAKFFKKNAEVTVTPVLVYNGTEANSAPVTFQGENVRGNYPTVSYNNGGTVTIPVNYTYNPDMLKSELYLAFNVQQGNKQYALPRVKVADGVIATAALADAAAETPAITPDKFQRYIQEAYKADIHFLVNQANIRESELKKEGLENFNRDLKNAADDNKRVIEEVNISSYASPEGTYEFNNRLAENREKETADYLTKNFEKQNINFGELTKQFTAEDWDGFQELVGKSDIQDKDLILGVLNMYKDPEEREREIRNLSSVFQVLASDILPQLRRSRLTASVKVIGKTDEEITNAYNNNPSSLSIDELLYAATLTDDESRKAKIYETAINLYPDDYRGYNNLGMSQYKMKDYQAAAANFAQAAKRAPQSGEVKLNQALVAMVNKDMNQATSLLGSAGGVNEAKSALGYAQLKQGNAQAAASNYAGTVNNNAALAQILNKNYSAASDILGKIKNPDATTYYLNAIVGARTNNAQAVTDGLKKAVAKDPSLAQRALNDLEFSNFNIQNIF